MERKTIVTWIVVTVVVLVVSLGVLQETRMGESRAFPITLASVLSLAFGVLALILVLRITFMKPDSESWLPTIIASAMSGMIYVGLMAGIGWASALGLSLLVCTIVLAPALRRESLNDDKGR